MRSSLLITIRLFIIPLAMVMGACAAPKTATENTAGNHPSHTENDVNRRPQAISLTTMTCPVDLPEGDADGTTVFCGRMVVPENWDDPEGRQVTLNYAVFKATDTKPSPDPVMYFDGGPGVSTFGQLAGLADIFAHLRERRDIILWEQRGNFYSSSLDCPDEVRDPRTAMSPEEFAALAAAQAAAPQPTLDPALLEPTTIGDKPQEVLEKERALAKFVTRNNDPVANCRRYYEEKGVDLTQYSTETSLRDAIALMGELNYAEYNIYGISYGTTLALETMRYYDEHGDQELPKVRSVFIDGVTPLFVDLAERGLIQPRNVLRVFSDCEADEKCSKDFPNIRHRLLGLLQKIEQQPITLKDGTEVTLEDLRSLLLFASSSNAASLPFLPRLIDELERGESAVHNLIKGRVKAAAPDSEIPIGIAAIDLLNLDTEKMINCNDRSVNLDIDRAFELYRSFEAPQLVTDLSPVVQQMITCEAWGIVNERAPLPEPVTSGLRTLVSNGAMDTATAVEWGEVASSNLSDSVMVTFPLSPHGASVRSECAKAVTRAFFDDPQAKLDLTCVEEMQPIFILLGDDLP